MPSIAASKPRNAVASRAMQSIQRSALDGYVLHGSGPEVRQNWKAPQLRRLLQVEDKKKKFRSIPIGGDHRSMAFLRPSVKAISPSWVKALCV